MFGKTIPAYASTARHVQGLTLNNIHTTLLTPDARPSTSL